MKGVALPGTNDRRPAAAVEAGKLRHARTQRVQRMERLNPGLVVFAGPFQIQSGDLELRKLEIDACAKMKAEFKKAGVPVKVVLNCDGAWVLRARDGLRTNLEEYKEKIKTRTASPRRAWGIKKGDDGV